MVSGWLANFSFNFFFPLFKSIGNDKEIKLLSK